MFTHNSNAFTVADIVQFHFFQIFIAHPYVATLQQLSGGCNAIIALQQPSGKATLSNGTANNLCSLR